MEGFLGGGPDISGAASPDGTGPDISGAASPDGTGPGISGEAVLVASPALYNLSRMNKLETFILVAGIDESQESKKEFDGEGKI
tara:strand:+ start:369 stop:620 length:252 start_codon:yes stop_codon:yes gene_type:complete